MEATEKVKTTVYEKQEETPYEPMDFFCTKCNHYMPDRAWPIDQCAMCGAFEIRLATEEDFEYWVKEVAIIFDIPVCLPKE